MAAASAEIAVITCFSYTTVLRDNGYVRGDLTHVINFLLSRGFKLCNIHIVTDLDPKLESGSLKSVFNYLDKQGGFYHVKSIIDYTETLIDIVTHQNVVFMYWSCHATPLGIICPSIKGPPQVCPAKTLTNIIMLAENDKILCVIDCCHASAVIDERIFPPNMIKKDLIFMFSCTDGQNSGVMVDRGASLFTFYTLQGFDVTGEVLFSDMIPVFDEISRYREERGKSEQTPIIRTTKDRDRFFDWF